MCCEEHKNQIGHFLDDELSPDARAEFAAHLETCSACSRELADLQELTSAIRKSSLADVPSALWDAIDDRLGANVGSHARRPAPGNGLLRSRRWALAASLAFVAGLGAFGLSLMDSTVSASTINFGVLLDGLPLDAQRAFQKFVTFYDGKPGSARDAKKFASSLDFETPTTLPGGFNLDSVYLLQIGNRPGVAASYTRNGEFLATIFHAPVTSENFGTHKDYPCVVGKHRGHKVEVGSWKMVHLTDPTTCHCLLSQLSEADELPAVMSAIAPNARAISHGANNHD